MDLRALQRPLKQQYRAEPAGAVITLRASAAYRARPTSTEQAMGLPSPLAEAHTGVGGPGTAACSGDLLLGALAACAQVTYQMVATAMGVPVESVAVTAEGDLDLRGTLGIAPDAPVGFGAIRLEFAVDAPDATPEQLAAVLEKTERYCVVLQTLTAPPAISVTGAAGSK